MRCTCCRELGHSNNDCPRDPNLKTNEDVDDELIRIGKITQNKRFYNDTLVTTTHFLKKCIKVPVIPGKMKIIAELAESFKKNFVS